MAQQRLGAELEVAVTEPPGDRECSHGMTLALGRVVRPRRAIQGQSPVLHGFLHAVEEALGPGHPAVRGGKVAMNRAMEKRQPACGLGRLRDLVLLEKGREGTLLELDRRDLLALEVGRPAQAVEDFSCLAPLACLLEARPGAVPVARRKGFPTSDQRIVGSGCAHRTHDDPRTLPPRVDLAPPEGGNSTVDYSGMFPCLRFGISTRLVCSLSSARISLGRVSWGTITSSM